MEAPKAGTSATTNPVLPPQRPYLPAPPAGLGRPAVQVGVGSVPFAAPSGAPLPGRPPPGPSLPGRPSRFAWFSRRLRPRKLVVAAVVVIVAAWVAGLAGAMVGTRLAASNDNPPRRPSKLGVVVGSPRSAPFAEIDVQSVADHVGASVVAIQVVMANSRGVGQSIGTGVIITSDGEILTNAHVVEGASTANVRFPGETEPRKATVLAVDTDRDLALLRVDATGLDAVTFADPHNIQVGDQVVAIGYALDLEGDPSVTLGIISGLNRSLSTGNGVLKGLVQTDAAISSGNSGGPLLNAKGEVVGINTLVALAPDGAAANNVGFAISSSELVPEIEVLRSKANGTVVETGFMGVQLAPRTDGGSGALVTVVVAGSPAAVAGMDKGDVVVAVDGTAVTGQAGLVGAIRDYQPGAVVILSITRAGKPLSLTLTLGTRPPDTTG